MPVTTDQLNRTFQITESPRKIVSLVPSQTELLFDLGLRDEVVGITKFCIHPDEWFHTKPRIGGTKKLDIEKIRSLSPDLIIANKEENEEDQICLLMKEFPVWVSDIYSLNNAMKMIREISAITGKGMKGNEIIGKIQNAFDELSEKKFESLSCLYLIWENPLMTIGIDTFISDMIIHAGFSNIFGDRSRYPVITMGEIKKRNPDVIFLASEPFPFTSKHLPELRKLMPETRVHLVDGEMFSWYGSRLLKSPSYFEKLRVKIQSAL